METPEKDLIEAKIDQGARERHFDVGAYFRNRLGNKEKESYAEWMDKLNLEETKCYETMGYHFQLLQAICKNPEMIALSAGEGSGERFSFQEVVQLVKDLENMAKKFLGRELERRSNPILDQLINAYNLLRIFVAQQKKATFTEDDEAASLSVRPHFDRDFMDLVETTFPVDMVTLIKSGETGESTNGQKIERNQISLALTKMVAALQMNEEEKEQFKNALKTIAKVRQKVLNGQNADTRISKELKIEDLREVVNSLANMECLRRIFPPSPEHGMRPTDQMFGLNEVQRLLKFIKSWEDTFRWLGTMKMGKLFHGEETDEEREKRLEEEREKRRDIIRIFTNSFNNIFPDPVAPMIVKRHREVLRRRIQRYKAIGDTVNAIVDEKLKSDLKRMLFQISTILSYLDYMWNMHTVGENEAGKHIIYPKKMLLLGPLILQETENLMAELNILAEKYHGNLGEEATNDEDDFFGATLRESIPPSGLALSYEDSQMFRLGPDKVIKLTHDTAMAAADIESDDDRKIAEQKDKLSNAMWTVASVLAFSIRDARRNLNATRVKNVLINEEDDKEQDSPITLSYDIHDFINDLKDVFSLVLFEIGRTFDHSITKQQVLPEIAAHEEEAARLRSEVYTLGTRIRPAMDILSYAVDKKNRARYVEEYVPGLQNIEIVDTLKEAVSALTKDISEFQRQQEINLKAKRYHEVLRGAGYEKLVRLANSIKDFETNYNAILDKNSVDIYVLRKRIDEFAEKTQLAATLEKLPRNGIIAAWLKDVEYLKKVESRILANGLKPAETEELQQKYAERFLHVLNVMFDIRAHEEVKHCYPEDPEDTVYAVDPRVREHFTAFIETNPLTEECSTENFTRQFNKFYKLMHLMSDFMQVCDLQKNPNTPEQEFLKEYDIKKAQALQEGYQKLLNADYTDMGKIQRNQLVLQMAICREALGHLFFRAPEQAEKLDFILSDMENTIRIRYENGKAMSQEDLETFYLQFIREAAENPIEIR